MHHPRKWNEPGDIWPRQHSDGPHHHLRPHHPCLVPQNTCALGLLRLDLKHQVGKDKKWDFCHIGITSRLSRILNICKEEVKPFPPVIDQVEEYTECYPIKCAVAFRSTLAHLTCASYSTFWLRHRWPSSEFGSLALQLWVSILQGLWAALLILELFDPEFRALFKAKLAKVTGGNTKALYSLGWIFSSLQVWHMSLSQSLI